MPHKTNPLIKFVQRQKARNDFIKRQRLNFRNKERVKKFKKTIMIREESRNRARESPIKSISRAIGKRKTPQTTTRITRTVRIVKPVKKRRIQAPRPKDFDFEF